MSIDELKAGFARLAEPVVPREDPYGRLLRRARRSRRVRATGWGTALAAGLAAALFAPLVAPSAGAPTPGPSPSGSGAGTGVDITPWVQRLLDTPTRGSLAGDRAFTAAIVARVQPQYLGFAPDLDQRTVLFAGDTGTYRTVLVALHSETRQMGVWLVSDKGASAQTLTQLRGRTSDAVKVLPAELDPFSATAVADGNANRYLAVGLAPAGCQVATKDFGHPQSWQDSATGDYVVRTDSLAISMMTYAKVTCGGVVRHQGPLNDGAQSAVRYPTPTRTQVDAVVAGARGTPPDRTDVDKAMTAIIQLDPVLPNQCTALWSGTVGSQPSRVVALGCATSVGKTAYIVYSSSGAGASFLSPVPPTVPVLGLPITGPLDQGMLVIAPPEATAIEYGTAHVPLVGGVATVQYSPVAAPARALDATGRVIANGTVPTPADVSMVEIEGAMVDSWG